MAPHWHQKTSYLSRSLTTVHKLLGCETWSPNWRWNIGCGCSRIGWEDIWTEDGRGNREICKEVHNEELYDRYSSPKLFGWSNKEEWDRRGRWHLWWDRRSAYTVLVVRREGKRGIGRPSRRWKDNIKKHLQAVGWGGMDWICLA